MVSCRSFIASPFLGSDIFMLLGSDEGLNNSKTMRGVGLVLTFFGLFGVLVFVVINKASQRAKKMRREHIFKVSLAHVLMMS